MKICTPCAPCIFGLFLIYFSSCTAPETTSSAKEEIEQIESEFAKMASDKGIGKVFEWFAADDAIIIRGGKGIVGKDSIRIYHEARVDPNAKLDWYPTRIKVSASGDMAHSYGNYTYQTLDSAGNPVKSSGNFSTVWQRQKDGNWRYIFD